MSKEHHIVYDREITTFIESLEDEPGINEPSVPELVIIRNKLYLYRQDKKPLKLAFTKEDFPALWAYYDGIIKTSAMPEFKDLPMLTMHNMANTVSFKLFLLRYRVSEFKTTIKNAFRYNKCQKIITTIFKK